jgi:hypothetical protein
MVMVEPLSDKTNAILGFLLQSARQCDAVLF